MPDTAPNAQLLRSLARLVRGLSTLFWGLPVALIVCVQTAATQILRSFNILPPLIVTAWVCYGLWQLGHFQKQERVWVHALDRAKILSVLLFGLSPFLFWWSQQPGQRFFLVMVAAMATTALLFLSSLNVVLHRLTAMLPDEALRQETKQFSALNRLLLLGILLLGVVTMLLLKFPALLSLPFNFDFILGASGFWLMIFLALLPLAMTMALIWKIKEVIMESLFGGQP